MRNIAISFLSVAALAVMFLASSCADPCKDIDCGANGTCVEGTCVCNNGYEGANCESRMTAKFAGTFDVNEPCTSNTYTYVCTISESSSDISRVNFNNFYDASGSFGITQSVYGTVDGSSITIPSQTVTDGVDSITVSGNGTIVATTGVITLAYNLTTNGAPATDACSAVTYTPQ